MAAGAGVPTDEGDVVGTTVGCGVPAGFGVPVLDGELVGVIRDFGRGVVAGRAVECPGRGEAAGCAGVEGATPVVADVGPTSTQATRATRKTALTTQVEVRTRRISRSRPDLRFPGRSAG